MACVLARGSCCKSIRVKMCCCWCWCCSFFCHQLAVFPSLLDVVVSHSVLIKLLHSRWGVNVEVRCTVAGHLAGTLLVLTTRHTVFLIVYLVRGTRTAPTLSWVPEF